MSAIVKLVSLDGAVQRVSTDADLGPSPAAAYRRQWRYGDGRPPAEWLGLPLLTGGWKPAPERSPAECMEVARSLARGRHQQAWVIGRLPVTGHLVGRARRFAAQYLRSITHLVERLRNAGVPFVLLGVGPRGGMANARCFIPGATDPRALRDETEIPRYERRTPPRPGRGVHYSPAELQEWAEACGEAA